MMPVAAFFNGSIAHQAIVKPAFKVPPLDYKLWNIWMEILLHSQTRSSEAGEIWYLMSRMHLTPNHYPSHSQTRPSLFYAKSFKRNHVKISVLNITIDSLDGHPTSGPFGPGENLSKWHKILPIKLLNSSYVRSCSILCDNKTLCWFLLSLQ